MDRKLAEFLSKKFKIDISQIVREFWEMVILYEISKSSVGKWLIFKGGTALRLSYNSPRFSEDLDFSLIRDKLNINQFKKLLVDIINEYPNVSIDDFCEKYNTYFGELKIIDNILPYPFRLKIEISKRKISSYAYEPRFIVSDAVPARFIMNVFTVDQIYKDKEDCIKTRAKPRDYFDLWYISQIIGLPYKFKSKINKIEIVREMRKYLPRNLYQVIDLL